MKWIFNSTYLCLYNWLLIGWFPYLSIFSSFMLCSKLVSMSDTLFRGSFLSIFKHFLESWFTLDVFYFSLPNDDALFICLFKILSFFYIILLNSFGLSYTRVCFLFWYEDDYCIEVWSPIIGSPNCPNKMWLVAETVVVVWPQWIESYSFVSI